MDTITLIGPLMGHLLVTGVISWMVKTTIVYLGMVVGLALGTHL